MLIGPAAEIGAATERRQLLDQYGAQFTAVTAGVVGAFILCIWWQRRQERYYLLFGLCSLLWSVRTLIYGIEVMPAEIWWWLRAGYFLVIGAATATLAWFFLEFAGLRWRKWAWVVAAYAIVGPVAVVASNGRLHEAVTTYWQGPLFLIVLVSLVRFAWWGYRHRSVEALIITGGVLLATVLAANDYATVSGLFARTRLYTLHLALPVLLLTIGALLGIRFVRALRTSEEANRVLAERLAEKERELAAHYDRQRLMEHRKASAAERQRIMQDMHDGLGAQLVSSLVMVERGGAQPEEIALLLRESLDEMRLAIDAFGQADIDLHGALAGLRYRMQPRLKAAGIEMDWTMDDAFAEGMQPDERTAMQLLRIVQESLSNVIRHSGATRVAVRFEADRDRFRITVADNGRGFEAKAPGTAGRGHGLSGIRARAHDIGGEADIETSPLGTTVVVRCRMPQLTEPARDAA
jgi:signal transduction histidine kinase